MLLCASELNVYATHCASFVQDVQQACTEFTFVAALVALVLADPVSFLFWSCLPHTIAPCVVWSDPRVAMSPKASSDEILTMA